MASVKTKIGREKMAKAHSGSLVGGLPAVTHIAFGTGGIDAVTGLPKKLTGAEIGLFNEAIRKTVTKTFPVTTTARYTARIDADADTLVGNNINEAALFDANGDMVAIKTFSNKGLDIGTVMEVDYDAEF